MTPDRAKADYRRRLRARRRALTQSARAAAHRAMAEHLCALRDELGARTVGVYAATPWEADPAGAVSAWLAAGLTVAWPRVEGDALGFYAAPSFAALVEGYRGIREPAPDAPAVPLAALELLVVPGVGFDRGGHRLGQGGGFYDRLLADPALSACAVGLAYAAQLVAQVPIDVRDQRLAAVVTEREVLRPEGCRVTVSGRRRSGVE